MGNHDSVTRMYNRCLKTANIPEDCEVINMVSHMCVRCVCVCVCVSLACLWGLGGGNERDFLLPGTRKDILIKQRTEEV